MASITALTFTVHRTDPDTNTTRVVAVGSGITDVDEMSWDEKLLALADWLPDAIPARYHTGTDVVHFKVVTEDAIVEYVGHGTFPLAFDRVDTPDGDRPGRPN